LERHFRRWRDWLRDEGLEWFRDRRIGKLSSREPFDNKGQVDLLVSFVECDHQSYC